MDFDKSETKKKKTIWKVEKSTEVKEKLPFKQYMSNFIDTYSSSFKVEGVDNKAYEREIYTKVNDGIIDTINQKYSQCENGSCEDGKLKNLYNIIKENYENKSDYTKTNALLKEFCKIIEEDPEVQDEAEMMATVLMTCL